MSLRCDTVPAPALRLIRRGRSDLVPQWDDSLDFAPSADDSPRNMGLADDRPVTASLKSQYEILAGLKATDDQLVRVLSDLSKLPQEKAAADGLLVTAKSAYESAKVQFETTEKSARQEELSVKEKEDFLKKAEAKLMEVKNNDEYRAALREMENHKKEKGNLEEKALELMSALESHKQRFQTDEAKFQEAKQMHDATAKKYAGDLHSLETMRNDLLKQREQSASQLDTGTAALFRKLSNRLKGAIVTAIDGSGRCASCHIQIRPQALNEIVGYKAVHTCGSCGKILVLRPVPAAIEAAN